MIIALGTDHRGFKHKEYIKTHLHVPGIAIEFQDFGTHTQERTDYPLFVTPVCRALQQGKAQAGILLCGSGIGMAIAANRFRSIYAAVVWNDAVAQAAKEDDNVNVLVIPSDFITDVQVIVCIVAWLSADFKKGRYQQRLDMIDTLTD